MKRRVVSDNEQRYRRALSRARIVMTQIELEIDDSEINEAYAKEKATEAILILMSNFPLDFPAIDTMLANVKEAEYFGAPK